MGGTFNHLKTVIKSITVTVKGSKMYKLKSGLYITAADKYVQVKTK
ncbi:hypothetical protein [Bacillus sp. HU-1818]|nr:hypothetical protein [Bacillus sp. HU-1818]